MKHKLYSKMISSNHQLQHVEKYKKYRNVLTNVLRKAKREYYSSLFMTHTNDTGQTWKVINDLLYSGNSKSKVTQVEKLCLDSNGRRTQVSSAEEIGQVFNDFFVNVGPNLASNIQEAIMVVALGIIFVIRIKVHYILNQLQNMKSNVNNCL